MSQNTYSLSLHTNAHTPSREKQNNSSYKRRKYDSYIYYQNILLKGTEMSQLYHHLNDKGVLQESGEGTVE